MQSISATLKRIKALMKQENVGKKEKQFYYR